MLRVCAGHCQGLKFRVQSSECGSLRFRVEGVRVNRAHGYFSGSGCIPKDYHHPERDQAGTCNLQKRPSGHATKCVPLSSVHFL